MTGSHFAIRAVRLGDEVCLARLNSALHARHVQERPEFFKQTNLEEVTAWFRTWLEKPTTRSWIAELGTAPAGYLLMSEHQRAENTFCLARHWHEIDHVAVEPEFRGRGIARALIQTALAAAAATGTRDVEIASWSFNTAAHAVFQRCGFRSRLVRFDAPVGR